MAATKIPVTASKTAKTEKKARKPLKKASDGSLRGVAKPKGWKPEKPMGGFDKKDILSLRKPQVRILETLKTAKNGLVRKDISERSKVEYAWLCNWIGQPDNAARKDRETRWGITSLLTLKFVTVREGEVDSKKAYIYTITDAGKNALAEYKDASKAKDKEKAKK